MFHKLSKQGKPELEVLAQQASNIVAIREGSVHIPIGSQYWIEHGDEVLFFRELPEGIEELETKLRLSGIKLSQIPNGSYHAMVFEEYDSKKDEIVHYHPPKFLLEQP